MSMMSWKRDDGSNSTHHYQLGNCPEESVLNQPCLEFAAVVKMQGTQMTVANYQTQHQYMTATGGRPVICICMISLRK